MRVSVDKLLEIATVPERPSQKDLALSVALGLCLIGIDLL